MGCSVSHPNCVSGNDQAATGGSTNETGIHKMSAQLAATPMNPDLIARAGREIWDRRIASLRRRVDGLADPPPDQGDRLAHRPARGASPHRRALVRPRPAPAPLQPRGRGRHPAAAQGDPRAQHRPPPRRPARLAGDAARTRWSPSASTSPTPTTTTGPRRTPSAGSPARSPGRWYPPERRAVATTRGIVDERGSAHSLAAATLAALSACGSSAAPPAGPSSGTTSGGAASTPPPTAATSAPASLAGGTANVSLLRRDHRNDVAADHGRVLGDPGQRHTVSLDRPASAGAEYDLEMEALRGEQDRAPARSHGQSWQPGSQRAQLGPARQHTQHGRLEQAR